MVRSIRSRTVLAALIAVLAAGACSDPASGPGGPPQSPGASGRDISPSPPASPPVLTVTPLPSAPPAPAPAVSGPGVATIGPDGADLAEAPAGRITGKLRAGVVVPVSAVQNGWAKILTPCELTKWLPVGSAVSSGRSEVVLDPGHGGNEPGATGPGGLAEKTVNLAVASRAAEILAGRGVTALLTRSDDYRATLNFRTELARAAHPAILVSVHHNAEPDGKMDRPGSETYYQIGSPASKRLAGLMYEEALRALSAFRADWVGDRDAGAKWRPNSRGGDYYGILRLAKEQGITAILAELAFISNPSEEALLATGETRNAEAQAVAQAAIRYLRSQDPGSGFTTPYPREQPAGPGGGRTGCSDPV